MNKSKVSAPVMGLKVQCDSLTPQLISVDSTFQKCPIAHAAGIPLFVKRLLDKPRKNSKRYIIVRMMSQPSEGLAPQDWQYGGMLPPAPTVLVARNDSIQFTINDWQVLDDFEMAMLDDGPRKVTRKDFIQFVKDGYSDREANIVLQVLYPKGMKLRVNGLLKNVELNGKIGTCIGRYEDSRIGMKVEDTYYAIHPKNLMTIEKDNEIDLERVD